MGDAEHRDNTGEGVRGLLVEWIHRRVANGGFAAEGHPIVMHRNADSKVHEEAPAAAEKPQKKARSRWRIVGVAFGVLLVLLIAARLALPSVLRWYVNSTIDQSPLYDGKIGDIDVHLWRGAYTIKDVKLNKVTGNVPVPLFAAKQVDLAIEWDALRHRKLVGRIEIEQPELNFVDDAQNSQDQTGAGGPWLKIIRDLFPFRINRAIINNGSIHFRAFHTNPPVDVYLSQLNASIDNLSNIRDEVTPLVSTVTAKALAMDQAELEYQMKLNPFSYHPSFQLAVRLVNLDVTKLNALTRGYGSFDFERGYFDLVVELKATHGQVDGYVKPLFRNLRVLSVQDIKDDNPVQFFWEALVGFASGILSNPQRDQFGTVIPVSGNLDQPQTDILATLGNVLRNAFVRAYLPRLQRNITPDLDGLEFGRGSVTDAPAIGKD
jgi:hypothetical protein